jgi:hypothetical protein
VFCEARSARCCRPATTFFKAPNASPGESGICWSKPSLAASKDVGKSIMLSLRCELSTTLLTGRIASKEVLSKAPAEGLEAGRGILKELDLCSPPLSARACLDELRRWGWGWGMLNEVFLLMIMGGSSSSSDSLSSSSHSPGYWRLTSFCDVCRTTLGVSSSFSTGTVSVRALPVSSMMRRVRGLRISGMDVRDPPLCRFSGEE